jgi:hypothetical protein
MMTSEQPRRKTVMNGRPAQSAVMELESMGLHGPFHVGSFAEPGLPGALSNSPLRLLGEIDEGMNPPVTSFASAQPISDGQHQGDDRSMDVCAPVLENTPKGRRRTCR